MQKRKVRSPEAQTCPWQLPLQFTRCLENTHVWFPVQLGVCVLCQQADSSQSAIQQINCGFENVWLGSTCRHEKRDELGLGCSSKALFTNFLGENITENGNLCKSAYHHLFSLTSLCMICSYNLHVGCLRVNLRRLTKSLTAELIVFRTYERKAESRSVFWAQ